MVHPDAHRRMVFPGANFGEDRPGRMEEMTVPLDVRNDIRSMDARGVPRAEIARELGFSSVNYFIRFFRKHTGTTPAAMRRECFSGSTVPAQR